MIGHAMVMHAPVSHATQRHASQTILQALTAMAAHEGPTCFFSFGAGAGSGMSSGQQAAAPPSGIVCTPTLGGGSSGGPAGRFVLLPKAGYSFAAWLQLEDGRGAAEQLASADTLLSQQAEHAAAAAAAASAAAVASDQAVFALLHQQQPSGSHSFMLHHQQQGHLLQGVALAIRRPPPAAIGPAGSPRSPREALQLVAHSWSPKHAEAVLPLQHPLVPGQWHHVAVSHSAGSSGSRGGASGLLGAGGGHCSLLVAVSLGFGPQKHARALPLSNSLLGQPLLVPPTAGGPLSHPTVCLYIDGQLQVSRTSPHPLHTHLLPPTWRQCVPSLSPVFGTNYRGHPQPHVCCTAHPSTFRFPALPALPRQPSGSSTPPSVTHSAACA